LLIDFNNLSKYNYFRIVLFSILVLVFSCSKEGSIDDLRDHCSTAYASPDDTYLRVINTLNVNIYIDYVDLPYSAHMWANSCELLGVIADRSSAIRIQRCESAGTRSDGGPVDCGDDGPTVRINYNLKSSETFEIIVDSNTFK
jgi:hypothetical protein